MSRRWLWAAMACFALGATFACDGDASGSDSDSNSDSDSDSDSDTDSDADSDTDAEYPSGPYGFEPSMELNTDMTSPGTLIGNGDVIPDVCLTNALGEEVCLGDFYRDPDHELVFVDFTTMW
jgi:hypothetical protein